jgi:hypothetical protein
MLEVERAKAMIKVKEKRPCNGTRGQTLSLRDSGRPPAYVCRDEELGGEEVGGGGGENAMKSDDGRLKDWTRLQDCRWTRLMNRLADFDRPDGHGTVTVQVGKVHGGLVSMAQKNRSWGPRPRESALVALARGLIHTWRPLTSIPGISRPPSPVPPASPTHIIIQYGVRSTGVPIVRTP